MAHYLDSRLDPVQRMFRDLAEADGELRVRFRDAAGQATEKTMTYTQYHRWLASAPSNGFTLERVETTKKPG